MSHCQDINNQTTGGNTTPEGLENCGMTVARSMTGELGEKVNIDVRFFCGWDAIFLIGVCVPPPS